MAYCLKTVVSTVGNGGSVTPRRTCSSRIEEIELPPTLAPLPRETEPFLSTRSRLPPITGWPLRVAWVGLGKVDKTLA